MEENKTEENGRGKPVTTQEQKDEMVRKLEPYIKSGLSIRKALSEAQVPRSSFYDLMTEDDEFADQINRFRNFVSVLLNNSIVRELQDIIKKQNEGIKLTKDDKEYLWKFATTSNLAREEFGERKDIGLVDPEVELNKIMSLIEKKSTKGQDNGTNK